MVLYSAVSNDTGGNCVRGLLSVAAPLVAPCSSEAVPEEGGKKVRDYSQNIIKMQQTFHVCRRREIVDESNAARIDRGVLKLFSNAQR